MSRVTISDLHAGIHHSRVDAYGLYKDIEIVPRKMVEMIIEKCEKDGATYLSHVANEALDIKKYAESLLKQFEEDD